MCPRGRPRGQGRPRGLHLCVLDRLLLFCRRHDRGVRAIFSKNDVLAEDLKFVR